MGVQYTAVLERKSCFMSEGSFSLRRLLLLLSLTVLLRCVLLVLLVCWAPSASAQEMTLYSCRTPGVGAG